MRDPRAPGSCVDCGNDAYIRLTKDESGEQRLICAHCFAARGSDATSAEAAAISPDIEAMRSWTTR